MSLVGLLGAVAVAGSACWVAAVIGLDRHGQRPLPPGSWEAIVVPGAAVGTDGRPRGAFSRRIHRAVELYREGRAPRLVITGGVGVHPPAEGVAGAALARELGVPDEALVIEDRSTSTEENARFAAEECPVQRVLVVTDCYHVLRSEWVFRRFFGEVHVHGTVPPRWQRLRYATREIGVLAAYALTGRLGSRLAASR